jgi:hypothetical protein
MWRESKGGWWSPTPAHNNQKPRPMHKEIQIEINHETLTKLNKLADERGTTIDELINESLQDELNALEPVNA